MPSWLTQVVVAGNELWRLLLFCAIMLLSLALGRVARFFVDRASRRHQTGEGAWVGVLLKALSRSIFLVAFALGFRVARIALHLGEGLDSLADTVVSVLNAAAIGFAFYCLSDLADYQLRRMAARTESKVDDALAPLVGKSVRVVIGAVVLLNVIQQISGRNITTILASLGVVGLAVALAGQDTIKNFFGSLVILGDKPFEIGDRISISGHDGVVEAVGFRSTKIRTPDGHLVTVPNSEVVSTTVQNIGKRPYIRRAMNLSIIRSTPPAKVAEAVAILRELLEGHEGMRPEFPPQVRFAGFGDCALNLEAVYWYHPPDQAAYMAFSERVNFEILRRFNEAGIAFAIPSQTVYLAERRSVSVAAGEATE